MKRLLQRFLNWLRADPISVADPTDFANLEAEPEAVAQPADFDDLTAPPLTLLVVRQPLQLFDPGLYELVLAALKSNPLADVKGGVLELMAAAGQQGAGIIAIREGDDWKGITIVNVGKGLVNGATVLHFHCVGAGRVRAALVRALTTFARAHGATRLFGIDVNNKPGAFVRLFGEIGPAKEYGRLVEFDLGDSP